MAGSKDFPTLGEALATIDGPLIYYEAKRQYESPLDEQRVDTSMTHQQGDLPLFYRNLFEKATTSLDALQKLRLLHLCFAYKTRKKVLYFLDLLQEEQTTRHDWVKPVKLVVLHAGQDTLFEQTAAHTRGVAAKTAQTNKAEPQESHASVELSAFPQSPGTMRTLTLPLRTRKLAPTNPQVQPTPMSNRPCRRHSIFSHPALMAPIQKSNIPQSSFVVPTLALAYPSDFFSAWASYAPLSRLTLPSLLVYPAVSQLALSSQLEDMLRNNFPDFAWTGVVSEDVKWTGFFEHLLGGGKMLIKVAGAALEFEGSGYRMGDMMGWIEESVVERERERRVGGKGKHGRGG